MKLILRICSLFVVCCALLAATGCKAKPETFLGTYSVDQQGEIKEFMRIEQKNGKLVIYEKDRRKWLTPFEVDEVDDVDLERILGTNITPGFTAYGNEMMAVLQVRKGWKLGNFSSKTGYVLASGLGPMDLYPVQKQ